MGGSSEAGARQENFAYRGGKGKKTCSGIENIEEVKLRKGRRGKEKERRKCVEAKRVTGENTLRN